MPAELALQLGDPRPQRLDHPGLLSDHPGLLSDHAGLLGVGGPQLSDHRLDDHGSVTIGIAGKRQDHSLQHLMRSSPLAQGPTGELSHTPQAVNPSPQHDPGPLNSYDE